MAPPPPVSRCSAAATAALEHLQGVEKQLQNEGLVFDMGTVQHLEEAIQAIKKLEGERKRILELLEEETIKNCNLRVKIKGMPQIVMEEFEALVAAARRAQVLKITEIEASAQEVESVVERTHSKQNFSEQHNLALSEEQKEFGDKQEKTVDILNQQLATKNSFYIQVNELLNMERDEEEESAFQINATDELEKEIVWAVSVFEKEQALLESQTADLQSKLLALKLQIAQKSMEYEALLAILCALQKQVEEKKQSEASNWSD
ncbi:myosin-11-like [Sphaerodactylus townsendi]|uniref:myosin-11-like n=1 Tax=Sphaerodactylus townsendi TaxID=933632 RepID=UPI002026ABCF|nr:myosin-11-like [Sphaerodactylus townsendi]